MGVSVSGTRLFGKVDAVPNLGHVATKFYHVNLLPLYPMESYFVVAQNHEGWVGVVLPTSWKSVAVAWVRTGLLALGIVIWASVLAQGNTLMNWAGLACVSVSIASNFIGRLNKADTERARELTELALAGLGEEDITRTRMEHGLPVSAEAMLRVARGESGNKPGRRGKV